MCLLDKINEAMGKLNYAFINPPILIGGGAMEHYKMRFTGHDFDFMISMEDYNELKNGGYTLNTFGGKKLDKDGLSTDSDNTFSSVGGLDIDLAVTMFQYRYKHFDVDTDRLGAYRVLSRENLLLMKSLAASNNEGWSEGNKSYMIAKQRRDMDLIIKSIVEHQYEKGAWDEAVSFNTALDKISFKF
jgi:hypothetical protein